MKRWKKIVSIFNRVKNEFSDEVIKPNIDELINSNDNELSLFVLWEYINYYCKFGDNLEILTEPQKVIYFNYLMDFEVCNGGFKQFYFNSSGEFPFETVDSLRAVGADTLADIVLLANQQFPNNFIPKYWVDRRELLEQISDIANVEWEKLEELYFSIHEELISLNFNYFKCHKEYF